MTACSLSLPASKASHTAFEASPWVVSHGRLHTTATVTLMLQPKQTCKTQQRLPGSDAPKQIPLPAYS